MEKIESFYDQFASSAIIHATFEYYQRFYFL